MFMCNLLAAGPTIAIVQTAQDFFPGWMKMGPVPEAGLVAAISKVAYFFTSTALLQGTGNLIWMPLVNKYGRRPIYLLSYSLYLACAIWAACTYSYGSFLAARILMGFGSGAAETMAPLSSTYDCYTKSRATFVIALSCRLAALLWEYRADLDQPSCGYILLA
jgi:MFS family permease